MGKGEEGGRASGWLGNGRKSLEACRRCQVSHFPRLLWRLLKGVDLWVVVLKVPPTGPLRRRRCDGVEGRGEWLRLCWLILSPFLAPGRKDNGTSLSWFKWMVKGVCFCIILSSTFPVFCVRRPESPWLPRLEVLSPPPPYLRGGGRRQSGGSGGGRVRGPRGDSVQVFACYPLAAQGLLLFLAPAGTDRPHHVVPPDCSGRLVRTSRLAFSFCECSCSCFRSFPVAPMMLCTEGRVLGRILDSKS